MFVVPLHMVSPSGAACSVGAEDTANREGDCLILQ